jgi:hypothetical protein
VQSSPAHTAAVQATEVAATTVPATESRTGIDASLPAAAPPSAGVRPRWLPGAVAVLGLATLALVGFAAWQLAALGFLPGFSGLDDRLAAAASRNADLQSRLEARSGDGQPCGPGAEPPGAGKGAAPPIPSPAALPGRSSPTAPASQDGGPVPAPVPAPAVPDRPATSPPAMPQMPQMPKLPDLPGTAPAPRSLQLPPTSLLAPPLDAGFCLAPGHRPGPLRRAQA